MKSITIKSPAFWIGLYLFLTTSFAVVYSFIPYGFRFENANLDWDYQNQMNKIFHSICREIFAGGPGGVIAPDKTLETGDNFCTFNLSANHVSTARLRGSDGQFYPAIKEVTLLNPLVENKIMKFDIQFSFEGGGNESFDEVAVNLSTPSSLKLTTVSREVFKDEKNCQEKSLLFYFLKCSDHPSELVRSNQGENRSIVFNEIEDRKTQNIKDLFMIGNKKRTSLTFFRALYFSAVTITTLGYGDILPMTHLARICSTLEALFGTIVISIIAASIYGFIVFRKEHPPK